MIRFSSMCRLIVRQFLSPLPLGEGWVRERSFRATNLLLLRSGLRLEAGRPHFARSGPTGVFAVAVVALTSAVAESAGRFDSDFAEVHHGRDPGCADSAD